MRLLVTVALAFGCSVGVIMLNNLVIDRSAELGRLDRERVHLHVGKRAHRRGAQPGGGARGRVRR